MGPSVPPMLTTPWRAHGAAPTEGQLLVIGDVHGRADALERLLRHLRELPPWGGSRELVFLGDVVDRGPDSLRALRLAWEARSLADRWLMLPGNHELMLMDALDAAAAPGQVASTNSPVDSPAARLWRANGGAALLREVDPERRLSPPEALHALRRALPSWFEPTVRGGPTHHVAGGFLLVHAGLDPRADEVAFLARSGGPAGNERWAWIREPFLAWTGGWGENGRQVVVHGHTPATLQPIRTVHEAAALLDRIDTHGRLWPGRRRGRDRPGGSGGGRRRPVPPPRRARSLAGCWPLPPEQVPGRPPL